MHNNFYYMSFTHNTADVSDLENNQWESVQLLFCVKAKANTAMLTHDQSAAALK